MTKEIIRKAGEFTFAYAGDSADVRDGKGRHVTVIRAVGEFDVYEAVQHWVDERELQIVTRAPDFGLLTPE